MSIFRKATWLLWLLVPPCGTPLADPGAAAAEPALVATAVDARAAVFGAGGAMFRVAIGERLPGVPWTLTAVHDRSVTLERHRHLLGRALSLDLAIGESLDASRMAALDVVEQPRSSPAVSVHVQPRSGRAPAKSGSR